MNATSTLGPADRNPVARRQDEYLRCLAAESVPARQRPYYLRRVKEFAAAATGRAPASLDEREIGELLAAFGRRTDLQGWQFAQLVDAVRIHLAVQLRSAGASQVDWAWWKGSARTLAPEHASTARESPPEELLRRKIEAGTGALADVRRRHEDLIVRFVTEIRVRGYAYRTEEAYEQWVCRFLAFCGDVSAREAGAGAVAGFLEELVVSANVSASTQNQALNALVFLYKRVLRMELGQLDDFARSKRKQIVPTVLTRSEVKALLGALDGWQLEIASLLYGTGMRLMEALTLRVKDVDFEYGRIHVHLAKGKKDRFVPLPAQLVDRLRARTTSVATLHARDLEAGRGEVLLPEALSRKYPNAAREPGWQLQELLGHSDVSTTMIYTHVLNRPGVRVASPLDL